MSHALEAPRRLPLPAFTPAGLSGAAFARDDALPRRSPRLGLAILLGFNGAAWSLIAWAAASVL